MKNIIELSFVSFGTKDVAAVDFINFLYLKVNLKHQYVTYRRYLKKIMQYASSFLTFEFNNNSKQSF